MVNNQKMGIIQWCLIIISFFFSLIVENNKAEIYIFISCSLVIFLGYLFAHRWKIRFRFTLYHFHIAAFCIYCYISSLWAVNRAQSIGKANTLMEIFVLMSVVFLCVDFDSKPVDKLLKSLMWAGFFSIIYIIANYGLATIIALLRDNARIDNSLINANNIGMMGAYSLLIAAYYILYEGFSLWNLMAIPTIIVIFGSASRKAFTILIIGLILLFLFRYHYKKNILQNFVRTIIIAAGSFLLLLFISRLPAFEFIMTRFQTMFMAFIGGANADNSSLTRLRLIDLGFNLFKENPVFGVGIDNATMYVASLFSKSYYYLHNNYIELLADGGIIGFASYYIFYIIAFVSMIRYSREFNISFVLLLLLLIMDLGMVSYYYKETYIIKMIIYFEYSQLEDKNKLIT